MFLYNTICILYCVWQRCHGNKGQRLNPPGGSAWNAERKKEWGKKGKQKSEVRIQWTENTNLIKDKLEVEMYGALMKVKGWERVGSVLLKPTLRRGSVKLWQLRFSVSISQHPLEKQSVAPEARPCTHRKLFFLHEACRDDLPAPHLHYSTSVCNLKATSALHRRECICLFSWSFCMMMALKACSWWL